MGSTARKSQSPQYGDLLGEGDRPTLLIQEPQMHNLHGDTNHTDKSNSGTFAVRLPIGERFLNNDHQRIKELFRQLKAKLPELFPQKGPPNVTPKHGIYIIYSPGGRILHVGRTLQGRNGLRQRLNNHLQGQSSFTVAYFKKRKKSHKLLRGRYKYAFVEVNNSRLRALLEAYAVGMLCPIHLGTGEINA